MTLRTLLLGSAAAVLTVGAAQAADLGAEPANYVKVCDAFGPGYYYAPGTDTCIKIGGLVRFEVHLLDDAKQWSNAYPTATHQFHSYFELNVSAKSMTEYGPLIGVIGVKGNDPLYSSPAGPGSSAVVVDYIDLALGALSAGYNWSPFAGPGQWAQGVYVPGLGQLGASKNNYIRLSWATSGIGAYVGAEDYRARVGNTASPGQIPDIVGGLNFGAGPVGFQVHAGWHDEIGTDSYGINGAASIDLSGTGLGGSSLLVAATYSGGDGTWVNNVTGAGVAGYTVYGALTLGLSSSFALLGEAAYTAQGASTLTAYVAEAQFRPVKNFLVAGSYQYTTTNAAVTTSKATIRIQRSFP